MVKKNISTLLALLTILMGGCYEAIDQDASIENIPSLGGTISRAVLESSVDQNDALFYLATPLLYSFEENTLNLGNGDSYVTSHDLFGEITFSISVSGSDVTYTGSNADNSIQITIEYDEGDDEFDLTQYAYIDDSNMIITGGGIALDVFLEISVDDAKLSSDGSFTGDIWYILITDLGGGLVSRVSGVSEFYSGELLSDQTGTGVAIQGEGFGTLPSNAGVPTSTAELSDMDSMIAYVELVDYEGFAAAATISEVNLIYYRIGQATAVLHNPTSDGDFSYIDNDLATSELQSYLNFKSLTTWAAATKFD